MKGDQLHVVMVRNPKVPGRITPSSPTCDLKVLGDFRSFPLRPVSEEEAAHAMANGSREEDVEV